MITEKQVVAALPNRGFLRSYVQHGARISDANIAYHLGGGLAILAQTVPANFAVPFGGPLYPNLYVLLVGPSTMSRKTAAVKLAMRVLRAAIPEAIGEAPGSHEALVDGLLGRPPTLYAYEEYGSFLSAAEGGYFRPIKTLYTQLYDCGPVSRRKANGKGVTVDNPRVSILAGVAPGYLEGHSEPIDWTEGFFARHLTFYAKRERYYALPPSIPAGEVALAATLKGYADVHMLVQAPVGPAAGFTTDALKAFTAWQHKVERIAQENPHRMTAAALGRAPGMALKVAGLLEWDVGTARGGDPWFVSEEAVVHATRIVDLHVSSVLEIGDLLSPDKDMRDRRRFLAAVNGEPRALGRLLTESKMLKKRGREILDTLLAEGVIEQVAVEGGEGEPHFVRAAVLPKPVPRILPATRMDDLISN